MARSKKGKLLGKAARKETEITHDPKIYRWHVCPFCASTVLPFADGTTRGHCPKCGPVIYASMLETDVPLFREGVSHFLIVDGVSSPEWFASVKEQPL